MPSHFRGTSADGEAFLAAKACTYLMDLSSAKKKYNKRQKR